MRKALFVTRWSRLLIGFILVPTLLFLTLTGIIYWKQDTIVQRVLVEVNTQFAGEIQIGGSHVSPFADFPHITIDLEKLRINESKSQEDQIAILSVEDAYIGFNLWSVLRGQYQVNRLYINKGDLNLIQYKDGNFNLVNALTPLNGDPTSEESADLNLKLDNIRLKDIDLHKINEDTQLEIELFVKNAIAKFSTKDEHMLAQIDSRFDLNVILDGDTSFIRHKHMELQTKVDYQGKTQWLEISPSLVKLEEAVFNLEGTFDLKGEMPVDLKVKGAKPNFDLFIAFAPEELIPTLKSYGNKGQVFFDATINGPTANGKMPHIEAEFGCKQGSIINTAN